MKDGKLHEAGICGNGKESLVFLYKQSYWIFLNLRQVNSSSEIIVTLSECIFCIIFTSAGMCNMVYNKDIAGLDFSSKLVDKPVICIW